MKLYSIITILLLSVSTLSAQEKHVYMRAMQDELNRSMTLTMPGAPSPFLVAYTIQDMELLSIRASNKAILSSRLQRMVAPNVRVVVGDYQLNSEMGGYANSAISELSLDGDYDFIRRTLWLSTDVGYKWSTQQLSEKQNRIKQGNFTEEELAIADLSKITPLNRVIREKVQEEIFIQKWEEYVRLVMKILEAEKRIEEYRVDVNGYKGEVFHLTSEGTSIQYPLSQFTVNVWVKTIHEGIVFQDDFEIRGATFADLPKEEKLKMAMEEFITYFIGLSEATPIEESYFGPVLFEEKAVGELFNSLLVSQLCAEKRGLGNYNRKINEDKIEKRVVAKDLNVLSLPSLQTYNGQKLCGSFAVDADGVVPTDSLLLVENGILKDLLANRSVTKFVSRSNGYHRLSVTNRFTPVIAPGVLKFSSSNPTNHNEMKGKLIEAVKKEGLAYGYRVERYNQGMGEKRSTKMFRVYTDGREELVQQGVINLVPSLLRRIVELSDSESIVNCNYSGVPVTYITPKAILVEEVEIDKFSGERHKAPIIKAPKHRY